eukprot:CAMPEP_0119328514 /NCGR_PEP_ID=MMETSP1333-20130426/73531_1 /TAXON_ID=418940 /ORGANISM="Scyphosphaera apsteinii, Strain RCC1455" /LENGTH=288 /DNA_ID=CAMNT_0007337391 /DNA_START=235 /DNA_END=1101 /DNA_ORIENTATION=-
MTLVMYLVSFLLYLPVSQSKNNYDATQIALAGRGATRSALLAVSTIYVGTSTFTKTALAYVDVPTQTILKSAKLLPVMLGSILILHKSFKAREWLAALMLISGMITFNLSSSHPPARQSFIGVVCIFIALTCDALLGSLQQQVLHAGTTVRGLMLYQSAFGVLAMLLTCVLSGNLWRGMALLLTNGAIGGALLVWAIAITGGTSLVLMLVGEFSAVVAVTVTTLRKAFTLLLSFVLFPKVTGWGHPIGVMLVLGSAFVQQGLLQPKLATCCRLLPWAKQGVVVRAVPV